MGKMLHGATVTKYVGRGLSALHLSSTKKRIFEIPIVQTPIVQEQLYFGDRLGCERKLLHDMD